MSLTELPRAAWTAALNDFSTTHEGCLVSLDVWTPEIGTLPEINGLPLICVAADRDQDNTISISASAENGHAMHTIHHPTSVTFERDRHGVVSALHVESAGGVKTTLRCQIPPDQS